MIRVDRATSTSFQTGDQKLQQLYDTGIRQLQGNIRELSPGLEVLVEGGGYDNAWLETQPMGGEMFAGFNLQVALNNQMVFIRTQREDGRLPGMVISGRKVADEGWNTKGFPPGHLWMPGPELVADFEMFQGYCFPEPAWRMYFWCGRNKDYLRLLDAALKGHDAYLWRVRDSNGDGLLESWCVWDTGEDGCTRLHERGMPESWPHESAPSSDAPGIPKPPPGTQAPFQSMDVMSYSYSGRAVLANIAAELGTGEEQKWREAAEEVRRTTIAKLWNPEKHACFDRDRDGKVLPELIHNNLRCMWHGLFTQEMADAFIRHHLLNPDEFWTPVPLVSIARNEPLFLSKPRNNWSGQPQGLTYQRAIHALERYGHHAEVTLLGRKLLPILVRNDFKFSQQLDPDTGKPSLSNSNGYGPMILAMLGYVERMHGIHIDPERGEVWWSGLLPEGGGFSYSRTWDGRRFEWEAANGVLTAKVNGKPMFTAGPGIRVVTNLEGELLTLVGVDPEPQPVAVRAGEQRWTGSVSPNEILGFTADGLKRARKVPFDHPFRGHDR